MADNIKWFSSENINAPELGNNWGSLLNILEACLLTGYGAQTIQSITIENGVATADFGTAHKLQMFQWVKISGSIHTTLNAEFKILGATSNTIEFLIDLPDQIIVEVITCSLAPLGWSKPYSDTGRAVFQAKDLAKNPYFLRVDDTCDSLHTPSRAKFAKVGILEACTGIDDISGNQAPFDPLAPTKNWIGTGAAGSTNANIGWARWMYATADGNSGIDYYTISSNAANGARSWILVGDDEGFYILPSVVIKSSTSQYKGYSVCYGFGIFQGKDCPFLSARHDYQAISNSTYAGDQHSFGSAGNGYLILLKNRNGSYITGATIGANNAKILYGLDTSGNTGYSNTFAISEDDGIYHCNFHAKDANDNYLGVIPLLRCVLNTTSLNLPENQIFSENGRAYIQRKHMGASRRAGSIIIDLGAII